jgi:ubiquinone biosynthesis protein UbiJ
MNASNAASQALIGVFKAALNRYLSLDPDTPARFAALSGKIIAVELEGLQRTLYFAPGPEGIQILEGCPGVPDATLRGTPWALLRLGGTPSGSREARMALASGAVQMSGDVELGRHFKDILDAVEIDWEEHLSALLGDVLAHQLGKAARALQSWSRQAAATLGQDFTEYQQEEVRNLPRPGDVQDFISAVDALRDDVERMKQRVRRLQISLSAASTDKPA